MSKCNHKGHSLKTVIHNGRIISGCDKCLPTLIQGDSAKFNRDWQKREYKKELTQPNEGTDFIRAYGVDKAREYMDDETIRRLA